MEPGVEVVAIAAVVDGACGTAIKENEGPARGRDADRREKRFRSRNGRPKTSAFTSSLSDSTCTTIVKHHSASCRVSLGLAPVWRARGCELFPTRSVTQSSSASTRSKYSGLTLARLLPRRVWWTRADADLPPLPRVGTSAGIKASEPVTSTTPSSRSRTPPRARARGHTSTRRRRRLAKLDYDRSIELLRGIE